MKTFRVQLDGQVFEIELDDVSPLKHDGVARVNGETVRVQILAQPDTLEAPDWLVIDDHPYNVALDADRATLHCQEQTYRVQVRDMAETSVRPLSADGRVKAPIPGVISRVLVEMGQRVNFGQALFILEAMKMENQIRAPRGGVVSALHASAGRGVALGELLAEIT